MTLQILEIWLDICLRVLISLVDQRRRRIGYIIAGISKSLMQQRWLKTLLNQGHRAFSCKLVWLTRPEPQQYLPLKKKYEDARRGHRYQLTTAPTDPGTYVQSRKKKVNVKVQMIQLNLLIQ